MNYYESLKKTIDNKSVDLEALKAEAQENAFEERFVTFFVERILASLITEHIGQINSENVFHAHDPKEFKFNLIKKTIGSREVYSRYLTYTKELCYSTECYGEGHYFDFGIKSNHECEMEIDEVVNYILTILKSQGYGLTDVHETGWLNTHPEEFTGTWDCPMSSFEKDEKIISFRCTIDQLINMYYSELMRYSYNYKVADYKAESDMFQEKLGKAK